MATKSFYKDVVIKDRKFASKLVIALEQAEKAAIIPDFKLTKNTQTIKRDQIKDFFKD